MADQLREEMSGLIKIQDQAYDQTIKSYEKIEQFKAQGNENEAEFHRVLYQTWLKQQRRLGEMILTKLKAVQKFEKLQNIEDPNIIDKMINEIIDKKQQQYMKYGPSDEDE